MHVSKTHPLLLSCRGLSKLLWEQLIRIREEKATPLIWGREELRVEVKVGEERGQMGRTVSEFPEAG